MKMKYALSTLCLSLAVTGCSLDATMYDGVAAEQVTAKNILELSNGSYRLLKMTMA